MYLMLMVSVVQSMVIQLYCFGPKVRQTIMATPDTFFVLFLN